MPSAKCPIICINIDPASKPVDKIGAAATSIKASIVTGTLILCSALFTAVFSDLNLSGMNEQYSIISGSR